MPRPLRVTTGDVVYHVLNRSNGGKQLFATDGDYLAFESILGQAQERVSMRVLTYCVMPNHWHLVLWPPRDGALSEFMRWLTLTHAQRWHAAHHTEGSGHLYQGRFKSFLVQEDEHFLTVCRYVEANPLRAGLVQSGTDWRWSGLWKRAHPGRGKVAFLSEWPVPRPNSWEEIVDERQSGVKLKEIRTSVQRGTPFGGLRWVEEAVRAYGLECCCKPRGRPRMRKGS